MNTCKIRPSIGSFVPKSGNTRSLFAFLTRLVRQREERDRTKLFYADGLRAVYRIADSPHFQPELFVYAPELLHRSVTTGARLVGTPHVQERLRERYPTIPRIALTPEQMTQLSESPEPQGIGAVVTQNWTPLYRLSPDAGLCYIALDTVRNPGNLGTILRTLEAIGGAGLICLPPDNPDDPDVDPFSPGVIRAAMGATFALRFARPETDEWERWRKKNNVMLVGTSPHTGVDYRSIPYGERVVLWMGGERKGLSAQQMARCDHLVRIPMAPTATSDSLNLATATSVLLYEIFNQRTPC